MNELQLSSEFCGLLRGELLAWPAYGSKTCIEAATADYAQLLTRSRSIEEQVAKLQADNARLRKEKVDVVQENTVIKQQAHKETLRAEARLRQDLKEARRRGDEATAEAAKVTAAFTEAANQRDGLQQHKQHLEKRVHELVDIRKKLQQELDDMGEALRGEKDARVAATEELQGRLDAKERAQKKCEEAEAKYLQVEQQYLAKVDESARAREEANAEFRKYKEMQQQLQREKELWDEQHAGGARPPPAVGLQRAAFNVGSMFGSVRNAIVAGATGHGRPSMEDAAAAADAAVVPLDTYEAAAKSSLPEMAFRQHPAAHGGGCNDVRFSPSGVWAASCGQDGCVKLWTTQDGGLSSDIQRAQATSASVNCVAFCEEKGLLMGASNDRGIKVWDMHTARPRFTMTGHDKAVTSVAQHPTSPNTAASCGEDRVIKLWSLNTGLCQRSIPCKSKPLCVAFSRDGNYLVSAHYDGSLRAYDAGSGTEAAHMQSLHTRSCVAVVPTAQPFTMVSVGRDDLVCVSDIFDVKRPARKFQHPDILHVGQSRCTPAAAPDDSVIAVGASSGLLLLLGMERGELVSKLSCHKSAITAVAWNAQGMERDVVTVSCDRAGAIVFWKAAAERADGS